jgi:hypothetical protein
MVLSRRRLLEERGTVRAFATNQRRSEREVAVVQARECHAAPTSGTPGPATAVGPDGRQQLWLTPDGLPDEEVAAVTKLATTVEPPSVTGGPVIVALLYSVGSEAGPHPGIEMPRSWTAIASAHEQGLTVDEIVLELWGDADASAAFATPLSDLITALVQGGGASAFQAFDEALLEAPLGVAISASTMPPGTHVVSADDHVTMPFVGSHGGPKLSRDGPEDQGGGRGADMQRSFGALGSANTRRDRAAAARRRHAEALVGVLEIELGGTLRR